MARGRMVFTMATWATLDLHTQRLLDDVMGSYGEETSGQIFRVADVRLHLEHAELLLALLRQLPGAEKTHDLLLTAGVPLYEIHMVQEQEFADFILPLRVRVNDLLMRPTSLASIVRLHPQWPTNATGDAPQSFFMVGMNYLGFYPTPASPLLAKVTYLRTPPRNQTSGSPLIDSIWHEMLPLYSASVLLASEGKVAEATQFFERFAKAAGLNKDPRFQKGSEQDDTTAASPQPIPTADADQHASRHVR